MSVRYESTKVNDSSQAGGSQGSTGNANPKSLPSTKWGLSAEYDYAKSSCVAVWLFYQ